MGRRDCLHYLKIQRNFGVMRRESLVAALGSNPRSNDFHKLEVLRRQTSNALYRMEEAIYLYRFGEEDAKRRRFAADQADDE